MSIDSYRTISRIGFDDVYGQRMWGKAWDAVKDRTKEVIYDTVAVDAEPINHILTQQGLPKDRLYPPWFRFCFEVTNTIRTERAQQAGLSLGTTKTTVLFVTVVDEGLEWHYRFASIVLMEKCGPMVMSLGIIKVLKEGGWLILNPMYPEQLEMATVIPRNSEFLRIAAKHMQLSASGVSKELEGDAICDGSSLLRFVAFMQARNIKAKKVFFPDYKPRKRQRHKVYRYYELTVVKPTIQAISQDHGEGVKGKALHSVRGHIAHYTEDKPLFGRSGLYGDFFIAQHVRGNIKYGMIKKRYRGRSLY